MRYWTSVIERRISRRRGLAALGLTAAVGAFMAACGYESNNKADKSSLVTQPVDTTKEARRGGIIKDRSFGDPPTLETTTSSNPHATAGPLAYSSLLQLKPGYLRPPEGEVMADLAESWEWSPDGLQISMKLRQPVRWHNKAPVNGRSMDVDDVLFSWNRFTQKSSGRAAIANSVDPRAPVVSLTATDSRTVVIKLTEPVIYALGLFSSNFAGGVVVVPKETDTSLDLRSDMVGTGPFVMTNYTPSVGFTFKRHPEYYDKDYAFADQVDVPIIPEYAAALTQFKAGNIYSMGSYVATPGVSQDDVLSVKKEEPRLLLYPGELRTPGSPISRMVFGWLPAGRSPFLDERVRQAISMSIDRDLFLDTFFNVSRFSSEGLSLETRWHTALAATYEGFWLDPKGKEFGPNAKYFKYDPAEARKLLAAAGHPNGIQDVNSHYVTGPELGNAPKQAEVIDAMIKEVGIVSRPHSIDYGSEYIPLYRDGRGQFEGWAYKSTAGGTPGGDAVGAIANEWWSKGGVTFHGFSLPGKNDQSGDPQVDSLIESARVERDVERRRALVFDIQRYLARPMYAMPLPGVASGFTMAWPCLRNFRVYQGARLNYRLWIDDTKAPLGKS